MIHNVRITDPGQQAIKINQNNAGTYPDDGVIACSRMELTAAGRPEIRDNCYTGGVDAHQAWGWRIHDNHIEGFWCDAGLSEHGIHMWRGCRDTVVERNVIVNCARGVGFGLAGSPADNQRMPDIAGGDDPCPDLRGGAYVDHWGGIVRNNFIFADDPGLFASATGFDGGVSLWNACNAAVVHNTVFSTQPPFLCIETRFEGTYALVANNLVSHRIQARTENTAELVSNVENAAAAWFVDALGGDLHLAPAGPSPAHGGAADLPAGVCDEDIDGDPRAAPRDVGADELP